MTACEHSGLRSFAETSYPYLWIALNCGEDYGEVLRFAEYPKDDMNVRDFSLSLRAMIAVMSVVLDTREVFDAVS